MIVPASPPDFAALLALNNAHPVETGELAPEKLRRLIEMSFRSRIVRPALALCIALDETADYASPNFLWIRERYPRFVYIDRVIVAAEARGQGLARALYADIMAAGRLAGHTRICCEVNTLPPNPVSDAFHERLGFAEIGRADQPWHHKAVRYLSREI